MKKVAVLADIHANIYALDAVLADCKCEKVDHIVVAGDLIRYYYWPKLVLTRLMEHAQVTCIKGNHEEMLREAIENDERSEFYYRKYGSGLDICRSQLSKKEVNWLFDLPISTNFQIDGVWLSV